MLWITQSIPAPEISFIQLGPFRVYFYALCILAGMVLALWLADRRLTKRGGESGIALDISLWAIPLGIVGGRIFHVITHPSDYFFEGADLLATIRIWEGGLAIYGALIFGSLGAYIGAKRAGVRFTSYLDAVAPGVLLAQAVGRWGNYFNQELLAPQPICRGVLRSTALTPPTHRVFQKESCSTQRSCMNPSGRW